MAIATPPTGVSNAELVRWALEQINSKDPSGLRELWSGDIVVRFPDRTCRGIAEVAAYFEDTFAALPDLRLEPVAVVEQGDDVFARWRLTGTQTGPVQGIAGTGRRIELDGMDHFVLRDGRIVLQLRRLRPDAVLAPARDPAGAGLGGRQGDEGGVQCPHELVQKLKER